MDEVDITVEGWDRQPVKLWIVTLTEQPDSEDREFTLFCGDRTVSVKRRMFNGEAIVDWDPESTDRAILFDHCKEELARFAREQLDRHMEFYRPGSQANLYVIRDYFTMTFGITVTSDPDRLTEHESYDLKEYSTVSSAMMENMT